VQLWWAGAGEGKINGWRRGRVKTPIAAMPQPKNKLGALWPDAASRPRWKNRFDAGPLRRKTNGMLRLILLPLRKPNTARLVALLYIYGGRKTIAKGNVESDRAAQAAQCCTASEIRSAPKVGGAHGPSLRRRRLPQSAWGLPRSRLRSLRAPRRRPSLSAPPGGAADRSLRM